MSCKGPKRGWAVVKCSTQKCVESEIKGEISIRNEVFLDPLITGGFMFLVINVLLDVIV